MDAGTSHRSWPHTLGERTAKLSNMNFLPFIQFWACCLDLLPPPGHDRGNKLEGRGGNSGKVSRFNRRHKLRRIIHFHRSLEVSVRQASLSKHGALHPNNFAPKSLLAFYPSLCREVTKQTCPHCTEYPNRSMGRRRKKNLICLSCMQKKVGFHQVYFSNFSELKYV